MTDPEFDKAAARQLADEWDGFEGQDGHDVVANLNTVARFQRFVRSACSHIEKLEGYIDGWKDLVATTAMDAEAVYARIAVLVEATRTIYLEMCKKGDFSSPSSVAARNALSRKDTEAEKLLTRLYAAEKVCDAIKDNLHLTHHTHRCLEIWRATCGEGHREETHT